MDLESAIRDVAVKIGEASSSGGQTYKQGVVSAVNGDLTVNVTVDSGSISNVVFLNGIPIVGRTVWLVSIGSGRWLGLGVQAGPSQQMFPPGILLPASGYGSYDVDPMGFLIPNGRDVSRATYSALWSHYGRDVGVCTMSIASPCVVTKVAHGLGTGDGVYFTTTGALPTGVVANTRYFVESLTADTFRFYTTRDTVNNGALSTLVASSGTQSGVHTAKRAAYGLGDGSTTFGIPDMRFRVARGMNRMGGLAAGHTGWFNGEGLGMYIGHQYLQSHDHPYLDQGNFSGATLAHYSTGDWWNNDSTRTTTATGAGGSQNVSPSTTVNWLLTT